MRKGQKKKVSHVVGVHFGASAITAVELKATDGGPFVVAKGSAEVRPGFFNPAAMESAASIGTQLSELLKTMGTTTKDVVFDVPAAFSSMRSYSFPLMPTEDLRAIIEGEVRHSNLLADKGGAFDFVQIGERERSTESNVVAVASDDPVLWFIADIARHAKLHPVARVPEHAALLRAMTTLSPPDNPTLYVSVTHGATEIAVMTQQTVHLLRRIDVRGSDLLAAAANIEDIEKLERQAEGLLEEDVPLALRATRAGANGMLDPVILQRLLTEVRRSVEFLRRSRADVAAVSSVVLSVSDDRWLNLQSALAESVGVPCEIADVSRFPGLDHTLSNSTYVTSLGLALNAFVRDDSPLPALDLAGSTRKMERVATSHSGTRPALIAAAAFFVVFLVTTAMFWIQGNSQNKTNDRLQAEYKRLEAEYLPEQEALRAEVAAISDLATKGIPFGPIMDEVGLSLDAKTALIAATFDLGGRITLQGQAASEEAIVNTLGRLRQIGGFQNTNVDSWEVRRDKGLVFNVSTNYDLTFPAQRAQEQETIGLGAGTMDGDKKILGEVVKQ